MTMVLMTVMFADNAEPSTGMTLSSIIVDVFIGLVVFLFSEHY